jgi:class 3 adenylate cyclase/predicted Ser/Thr protein kinase
VLRLHDPQTNQRIDCPPGQILIVGRPAPNANPDVPCDGPRVSRKHCELVVLHGDQLRITNYSQFGTKVNEVEVRGTTDVGPGDVIRLSEDYVLHVELETKPAQGAETLPPSSYEALSTASGSHITGLSDPPLPSWWAESGNPTQEGVSRILTLVFTDLAGSLQLKTELGDAAAGKLISRHHEHVRRLTNEHDGMEIDNAGDGFFLVFRTTSAAVLFGLALQRAHHSEPSLPKVRVGIHLGEVTQRAAPPGAQKRILVEGLAVDMASRIESLANPGQVLMSFTVFLEARRRLAKTPAGRDIEWCEHGPWLFKGFEDYPTDVGEARLQATEPPTGSDKASRCQAREQATLNQRYHVIKELGRGGMGIVFEAHDTTLDKRCAIKLLQTGKVPPEAVKRFEQEAMLGAKLGEHAMIVAVYDLGTWPETGELFCAMDFVEGTALVRRIREGLPIREGARITADVARTVAFAHSKGVIHRDLKPQNVMITPANEVRLIDFGIAKVQERAKVTSLTGRPMGTPEFMAPEQIVDSKRVGQGADIYGLAGILYMVLTGHPPFTRKGRTLGEFMATVMRGEPKPPSQLNPEVPVALEDICLRSLAKQADRRHPTAEAFAVDLEAWLKTVEKQG